METEYLQGLSGVHRQLWNGTQIASDLMKAHPRSYNEHTDPTLLLRIKV